MLRIIQMGQPLPNRSGLTLMEVLCLLVILAFALWLVYPKIGHGTARIIPSLNQLGSFKEELAAFRDDNGFYPNTKDGLHTLVRPTVGATNWHGPYAKKIPKDAWG